MKVILTILIILLVTVPVLAEDTRFLSLNLAGIGDDRYCISYEFEIPGHKARDIAITGLFYHDESSYNRPDIIAGDPNTYPEDHNWEWNSFETSIAFNKYSNGQVSHGYFWGPRLGLRHTSAKLTKTGSGRDTFRKTQLYAIPQVGLGYKWNLPYHIGIALAFDAGYVIGSRIELDDLLILGNDDYGAQFNTGVNLGYNW